MSEKSDAETLKPDDTKAPDTTPTNGDLQPDRQNGSKSQQSKGTDLDIFILDSVFPDPEAIFTFLPRTIEDIKDECIVVLDANTLLIPYLVNQDPLNEIEKTYQLLVDAKRLVIPAQAAREFAKHRAMKISQIYQQLLRKQTSVKDVELDKFHLLSENEAYKAATKLKTEINDQIKQFRNEVGVLLEHIRGWTWNDPVSILYRALFKGVVRETTISRDDLRRDLVRRQDHKLSPGYKDAAKSTDGVGDLLIWHTILDIGRLGKSVIFVSNDEKPDWRIRSDNQALYPRYELVDEFRRVSDGQSFHIVDLAILLKLFGASEQVVREVRQGEARGLTNQLPVGDWPWIPTLSDAEDAVSLWLIDRLPNAMDIYHHLEDDIIIEARLLDKSIVRTYVTVLNSVHDLRFVEQLTGRAVGDMEAGVTQRFIVAAVAISEIEAARIVTSFSGLRSRWLPNQCELVLGYLDRDRSFHVKSKIQNMDGTQSWSV